MYLYIHIYYLNKYVNFKLAVNSKCSLCTKSISTINNYFNFINKLLYTYTNRKTPAITSHNVLNFSTPTSVLDAYTLNIFNQNVQRTG